MLRDLTARQIATLTKPGYHRVARGLYLQIRPPSRSWLMRYNRNGRNVWLGLGRADIVTLEAAKLKVLEYQRMRDGGRDPLTEKRRAKRGETFQQVAEAYLAEHLPHFKNEVHKAQWQSTLTRYAFPKIGSMLCRDIQPEDIAAVLRPLASTPETQKRLRGRLAKIMDAAKAARLCDGDNPADLRIIRHLLAVQGKAKIKHHAAVPWRDLPELVAEIRAKDTMSHKALLWTILTACRTGETIGATHSEIDGTVWTIPPHRTKTDAEHRVPLSRQAVELLASIPKRGPFLFYGKGKTPHPLSNMAMLTALKKLRPAATTHGFRSSFRDFASENGYPAEHAERALNHAVPGKVQSAYLRTTHFAARVEMMQHWADFLYVDAVAMFVRLQKANR